jgi:hypothetical protein
MVTARERGTTAAERREAPRLVADLAELLRALKALVDPYHPERHYMRGPGPKWRAKHRAPAPVSAAVVPALVPANVA